MRPDVPLMTVLLLWSLEVAVAADGPPPAAVDTANVTLLNVAPRIWVPGTVLSRTDADIGVEVAGRVTWIADPGTRAQQGEAVAGLDGELWRIAIEDAEANVRRLEARLVYLQRESERLESLAEVNNAARSRLEESVAERDMGLQDIEQARAALKRNRHMLARTEIRAPFGGQIVERLAETGEYVERGDSVVRLVDLEHLEIRVQAPLKVAPFVRDDLTLPVEADTATVDAPVTTVIPVGNLESRSFEIRLESPRPDWVIGTPVKVGLPTSAARRIIAVPRDALVLRETGPSVFVIEDSRARQIPVETGIGAGERIEVISDALQPGNVVVVRGAEMLRDGQRVANRADRIAGSPETPTG